ncbi:MAG: caspase family protein [Acidobacteria bacterium]|nr:caspase family protein [Acidobacteriota bacterium]
MARVLSIFILFAGGISLPTLSNSALSAGAFQDETLLSRTQVEQLIDNRIIEDEVKASVIRKRGLDFKLTPALREQLIKRGAGTQIIQALEEQDEIAAFAAYSKEKDPVLRLKIGQELKRNYPQNPRVAAIASEMGGLELELFESSYRKFDANPNAANLKTVLDLGTEQLNKNNDRMTELHVRTRLASATGKGMVGNFYTDLENSRKYASQALALLENTASVSSQDIDKFNSLRADNLGMVYQFMGLYLLRQQAPDADQAIGFLNRAAEFKAGSSAVDPNTFWLRAMARDMKFQKSGEEYRNLPKNQRVGRQAQSLCAIFNELVNQLIEDYASVIKFSSAAGSTQLQGEAISALSQLATGERPCSGRGELISELPSPENRYALVVGAEDYLDKKVGKFNFAGADAHAVVEILNQHLGFPRDQIALLASGESPDRQPLKSLILKHLADLPEHVKPNGLLLIYFAGHVFESNGKIFLLATDSMTGNESLLAETAINLERIRDLVRASGAGQVMLLFDSFRLTPLSENFSRLLTFDVRKNEVSAFAAFFAAGIGQRSYESKTKKLGYFTAALIDAARNKTPGNKRVITLDDLLKHLRGTVPQEVQKELGQTAEQSPSDVVAGYKAEDLILFTLENNVKPLAPQAGKQSPPELARAAKTIYIRPKTVYLSATLLEEELIKLPEFKALGLTITKDINQADIVVEVTLPFLTWNWNYILKHRTTNTVLSTGNRKGATDNSASPKLAADIVRDIQTLRATPPPPKK